MQLSRPEIVGTFGAVSSSHWIASSCAMRILEDGGNAFDAAAAAGFVLQVVAPHLNGIAGDVAILLHRASDRRTLSVCGQGPVPASATIDRIRGLGLDMVPGTGLLSAVVPGAFDAWMLTLRDFGTRSAAEILEPAIYYASRGVPVSPRLRDTLVAASGLFQRYWPKSAELYLPDGSVPAVDVLVRNSPLAATFRKLAAAGRHTVDRAGGIDAVRREWSQGFVAEAVDRFCRTAVAMDVTGREHGALLTGDDMGRWSAAIEPAVSMNFAGWQIAKCGPWTQGPALLQTLALLDPEEMARCDPEGAEFVHRVTEAMKLAFADREVYYGDPGDGRVPMEQLLSPGYTRDRRKLIGEVADNTWRPGQVPGLPADFDYAAAAARVREGGLLSAYGGGEPTVGEPTVAEVANPEYRASVAGDTCHLDVVDAHGNMVSATPSGGWLQSSPVIPELGFPLGTRAQMTWLDPRSPSRLEPGTRPRTTLTPTLVMDGAGQGRIACGTPGGDQQDQWQAVFLLRHLLHGYGLQQAIESPSFHSEHWPNSFYPRHASPGRLVVEDRFGRDVITELERRGHQVVENGPWSEGRLTAVAREPDGRVRAAANPRGGIGYAVGR